MTTKKTAMKGTELHALRTACKVYIALTSGQFEGPMTQTEAAARIGVTKNTYARWERGELPISLTVARLARIVLRSNFDIGELDDSG